MKLKFFTFLEMFFERFLKNLKKKKKFFWINY